MSKSKAYTCSQDDDTVNEGSHNDYSADDNKENRIIDFRVA